MFLAPQVQQEEEEIQQDVSNDSDTSSMVYHEANEQAATEEEPTTTRLWDLLQELATLPPPKTNLETTTLQPATTSNESSIPLLLLQHDYFHDVLSVFITKLRERSLQEDPPYSYTRARLMQSTLGDQSECLKKQALFHWNGRVVDILEQLTALLRMVVSAELRAIQAATRQVQDALNDLNEMQKAQMPQKQQHLLLEQNQNLQERVQSHRRVALLQELLACHILPFSVQLPPGSTATTQLVMEYPTCIEGVVLQQQTTNTDDDDNMTFSWNYTDNNNSSSCCCTPTSPAALLYRCRLQSLLLLQSSTDTGSVLRLVENVNAWTRAMLAATRQYWVHVQKHGQEMMILQIGMKKAATLREILLTIIYEDLCMGQPRRVVVANHSAATNRLRQEWEQMNEPLFVGPILRVWEKEEETAK